MDLADTVIQRINKHTGSEICRTSPLGGGCIGDVRKVELADGRQLVAKQGNNSGNLAIEGFMLRYLANQGSFPVPAVLFCDEDMLLLQFLPSNGNIDKAAEINAADAVADLHHITQDNFGFECDTLIGGLTQPNPLTGSWLDFFREARLFHMADEAVVEQRLPTVLRHRIDNIAKRLETWIDETAPPALLHGDLWGGNILCNDSRVSGFIDPAIYFGNPEIELAFTTLFKTFGSVFFDRYREHHKITPGFFEERRDLYNLYPLLVHVRLFGSTYVESVNQTLAKYGC